MQPLKPGKDSTNAISYKDPISIVDIYGLILHKKTLIFIMPSCNLIYIICAIELHCCPRTLINTAVSPTTVYFKSAASTPPCCCKYPKEFQMSLIQSWKWSQKCFLFSISKLPPAVLVNYKVLHKDEAMNLWAPQLRKSKKKDYSFLL